MQRQNSARILLALLALLTLQGLRAAEPAKGAELFKKRCGGCHSLDHDGEGPRLGGVYGRRAGSVASFEYSAALKKSDIMWDDALLEQWLTDTEKLIPGNDMSFRVLDAGERREIVSFLKEASAAVQQK